MPLYIQNAINNREALQGFDKENISVTASDILGGKFCVVNEKEIYSDYQER